MVPTKVGRPVGPAAGGRTGGRLPVTPLSPLLAIELARWRGWLARASSLLSCGGAWRAAFRVGSCCVLWQCLGSRAAPHPREDIPGSQNTHTRLEDPFQGRRRRRRGNTSELLQQLLFAAPTSGRTPPRYLKALEQFSEQFVGILHGLVDRYGQNAQHFTISGGSWPHLGQCWPDLAEFGDRCVNISQQTLR